MTETNEVDAKHKLDEAKLTAFMRDRVEGYEGPLTVKQFAGGQSNPTYRLDTPTASYVLRRKPPGQLVRSAHAVDREFRVIQALYDTEFPVPKVYALCEDDSVLGTTFYIMECVDGRIFWNFQMPELSPRERGAALMSMIDNLAKLHMLDYKSLGLEDFGRPGNYFSRQISLWTKQFEHSPAVGLPNVDNLIAWLPSAIPEDDAVSLVHGDYSIHNLLFHPTKPKLEAALDWELSTIGHPLADLFYSAMPYYSPDPTGTSERSFLNLDCVQHGIPTLDQYLQAYCEHTGRVSIKNPSFYKAFTLFRIAGILHGIVGRIEGGTANDPNADRENYRTQVQHLTDAAWDFARDAGASDD